MTNIQQIRACRAFGISTEVLNDSNYSALAKNLPSMLQMNGLLATWAFLLFKAKKTDRANFLLETLFKHLTDSNVGMDFPEAYKILSIAEPVEFFTSYLVNASISPKNSDLMELTAEAIKMAVWLKRSVEALEKGEV